MKRAFHSTHCSREGKRVGLTWEKARSVFLSDLHLGWQLSNPEAALEFLNVCDPRYVYLVGDTFEGFHRSLDLRSSTALRLWSALRNLAARGTEVVVLTGNHDCALAGMCDETPFRATAHAVHTNLQGERFLVTHGDIFDYLDASAGTFTKEFGSWIYPWLVRSGDLLQLLGFLPKAQRGIWCEYWKRGLREARAHIEAFEQSMVELAQHYECDGVICGHIHRPDRKRLNDRWYINCGDWVEHHSLVLETYDGQMLLVSDLWT
jgi:UDP-2,3-diacylglucosamine pyrophosphatase LpxH